MKNREQKTLEKLWSLKRFVLERPEANQSDWYRNSKLSRTMFRAIVSNGIIKNAGNKRNPNYYWSGPLPNVKMVEKLIEFQDRYFNSKFSEREERTGLASKRKMNRIVLATTETTNKRESFLSALLSVTNEFSVNGFNVAINEETAVISRNNESITLTEPTMLTKVFRIVSA